MGFFGFSQRGNMTGQLRMKPNYAGRKGFLGKASIALYTAAVLLAPQASAAGPNANGVLFVDQARTGGTHAGDSWGNAMQGLGTALEMAKDLPPGIVKQIWVAQGTYYPSTLPGDFQLPDIVLTDRDKTFILPKNVAVYGGFTGVEASPTARTLTSSATILSGDIGVQSDNSDNAYHVVVSPGDVGSTVLDRLTIRDGNADYEEPYDPNDPFPMPTNMIWIEGETVYRDTGAGLYIISGSPDLRDIRIISNSAYGDGGGCYITYSESQIENIIVSGNTSLSYGAGFNIKSSDLSLTNGLVTGNLGYAYGVALDCSNSTVNLTNITVSGNRGTGSNAAGVYSNHSDSVVRLRNSIVAGNVGGEGNEANTSTFDHGTYEFRSSIIGNTYYDAAGTASTPGSLGVANLFIDPKPGSAAPTLAGDYHLKAGAYSINAGDDDYFQSGQTPDLSTITTDLDHLLRIIPPAVDLGPYEFGSTAGVAAWAAYN